MDKGFNFLLLAGLFAIVVGSVAYSANTNCYEVIPPQGLMQQIFLDKCSGNTWVLVRADLEDNNPKEFTHRWAPINFTDGEAVWKK